MQIGKIGTKLIYPAIIAAATAVGASAQQNNTKDYSLTSEKTEIQLVQNPDVFESKTEKKTFKIDPLCVFIGTIIGVGVSMGLDKLRDNIIDKKLKKAHSRPVLNLFDIKPIKKKLHANKFIKYRSPVLEAVNILLDRTRGGYVGYSNFGFTIKNFINAYPDRKPLMDAFDQVLADTRLTPAGAHNVAEYFAYKALSTADEWKDMEYRYERFKNATNYEQVIEAALEYPTADEMEEIKARRAFQTKADMAIEAESKRDGGNNIPTKKNISGATFKDVGGQDGAIRALKRGILYPIKYPEAYSDTKVEHGFVLYGPPGTGKTLLAEALSNETNAHFIKINGPELENKWVGGTEENWRRIFAEARKNQPSIIFIDEFDGVASRRGNDVHGDKSLTQILALISDIKKDDKIFVIAATNRLDNIDEAFIRSGRLGTHIELKAPSTVDTVRQILDIHTKDKRMDSGVDNGIIAEKLFKLSPSGADIAQIVNQARENSMERCGIYEFMECGVFEQEYLKDLKITTEDFEKAIDSFKDSKFSRPKIGFNK